MEYTDISFSFKDLKLEIEQFVVLKTAKPCKGT